MLVLTQGDEPPMNLLSDFALRQPLQAAQLSHEWRPVLRRLLAADKDPIPPVALRRGPCADHRTDYWVSGALDAFKVASSFSGDGPLLPPGTAALDFGCASGRVLRHLVRLGSDDVRAWGTDVNPNMMAWMRDNLTAPMTLFARGQAPPLPFDDVTFDLVTAFSAFTHFDRDEESWLLELRRVLKPGGLLYATTLGSSVWREIDDGHVLIQNLGALDEFALQTFGGDMPAPRLAFGLDEGDPYSYTVFRTRAYIQEHWASHFTRFEFLEQCHDFQDVCLLRR
jgi:ubiquinone/menaquinone biosynthesis C-methylase UbiE